MRLGGFGFSYIVHRNRHLHDSVRRVPLTGVIPTSTENIHKCSPTFWQSWRRSSLTKMTLSPLSSSTSIILHLHPKSPAFYRCSSSSCSLLPVPYHLKERYHKKTNKRKLQSMESMVMYKNDQNNHYSKATADLYQETPCLFACQLLSGNKR